jgi:undecaprenyl diphosphate synthase
MVLIDQIDKERIPEHIAIIMDGNGRWAKKQGKPRVFGHKNGVKSVREVTEGCAELGIKYLTLYAFSTENWNRPKLEVTALMTLLVETIKTEVSMLNKNNIRLETIGNVDALPNKSRKALLQAIEDTKDNDGLCLILALNYSAKWDIMQAVKTIADKVERKELSASQLTESDFESALSTKNIPDPELLIRTSGESRISNFLLWEIAYSELFFTPVLWPDFRKENLFEAILDFQSRERRFGKISEQIQ